MNTSTQIPSEMEYVKYLNLGCGIAIAMCHITTIFFSFHVIYCSKFNKKCTKLDRISNSFFIFLACRGFGAMLATPYPVYLTVYWSAEGGRNYEPYAHLWLGLGMIIHSTLATLSALLLTFERCFILTIPMRYNTRIAKCFLWLTLVCFVLCTIFVTFYVLGEIPLDVEKVHNCQYLMCVLLKYHVMVPQYVKSGMGVLNVLGSCYLMFAIKWNNSDKLKNDVVKFTITMDIFLDVSVMFANSMFATIAGYSPSIYTGQLAFLIVFSNPTVCSIYYSWRLTRKHSGSWIKTQQVTPATTAI